ncbi:dephospho-CoA kinase [Shewanella intestini]|uniref:Dephospho-CoA kinase n=1 Tax=Shewanella intestini TaxID=2017544 RepID=A0ABS5I537_9GAMM|nr:MULTISPECIES: dephospho-CoA kinase [Shewanella]MBR9729129.1 dephospho-CoA kinase [Shewanella intestini]MRG37205.1 dephospho-CoA kinase [Shewanella sp. XMDDZSB0408]
MAKPFIVGLTGGIGSGKTTVANLFAEKGIELVDADIVAREVVAQGSIGLESIKTHFGVEVISANGELNRQALRELVFNDDKQRQWLNNLLHPLIRQTMMQQVAQAQSEYVILVVPLLFENGLDSLVNTTLVVDISPTLQQQRSAKRDNTSAAAIQKIINSQMSREQRLAKAQYVIDNQGDVTKLTQQVNQLHQHFLIQAKQVNS